MENHKQQFRGVWIPAEIFTLLEQGTINCQEVLLLAIIDSLVSPDKGCWATNKYLGERIGVGADRIVRMVSHLRELDLLKQVGFDGKRRYLETAWSRIVEPRQKRLDCLGVSAYALFKVPPTGEPKSNNNKGEPRVKPRGPSGGNMPFIQTSKQTSNTTPTEFDFQCAQTLHDVVSKARRRTGRWSHKKWANEFRILRQELEDGKNRIRQALHFYKLHVGEKGVPKIDGPPSFRRCFNWLEDVMKRYQGAERPTEITPEAKAIAQRLHGKHWPKGSREQVALAVQVSLDRLAKFRKQVSAKFDLEGHKIHERLASRILTNIGQHAHFVEQWFLAVNKDIQNWDDWSGDLMSMAFDPTSKRFRRMGREWTEAYCAVPEKFDQLMERLKDAG